MNVKTRVRVAPADLLPENSTTPPYIFIYIWGVGVRE